MNAGNVKAAYLACEKDKASRGKKMAPMGAQRERDYERRTWRLAKVELSSCFFRWDKGMGGREWANGTVPEVAAKFRHHQGDPLWHLVGEILRGKRVAPIIVLRDTEKYFVDDGCHRAIALYLAGQSTTDAFIGKIPWWRKFFL